MSQQIFIVAITVAAWIAAKIISGGSLLPIDVEVSLTGRWSQPVAGAWFRYVEINDGFAKVKAKEVEVTSYRVLKGVCVSFQLLWFKLTLFILPVMYTVVRKPEVPDIAVNAFIKKVQEANERTIERVQEIIQTTNEITEIRKMCVEYYNQVVDLTATIEQLMKMQKINGNAKD
jgi:hypothetical protein